MKKGAREEAKLSGLKRYRSDKACPNGHSDFRFVSNGRCVVCIDIDKRKYRAFNAEGIRARRREKRRDDGDELRLQDRLRRSLNPEKHRERKKAWRKKNPDYERVKYANDVNFKVASNLRCRLRAAVKNGAKSGSAVSDLGCSINEFKVKMEALFIPGMSWDNYGAWQIDHRKPLAAFDLTVREQLLEACNWRNLQPLWALDNQRKSASHVPE